MAAGKQLLPAISCQPNSFLEWLMVTGQIDTLFQITLLAEKDIKFQLNLQK